MNPELERLVRLQKAESELRQAEQARADVPGRKLEVEAALTLERTRLDAVREALDACQKSRRRYEAELQDLESKRSKYKAQLMDVKTNKEYTAMLHEIEGVEREVRVREDHILAEMERGEALAAEAKQEEGVFKAAEERARVTLKALDEEQRTFEAEVARLTGERDAVAATLAPEVLSLFQRVAKKRGAAVAEARDAMCQLCHMKLRPQMYVDLKRNEEIVQCPSCSRILYFDPPPPSAAMPEPPALS